MLGIISMQLTSLSALAARGNHGFKVWGVRAPKWGVGHGEGLSPSPLGEGSGEFFLFFLSEKWLV